MSIYALTDGGRRPHFKRHVGPKRTKSTVCPRSASCFTCPAPDCVASSKYYYNEILDDALYFDLIGRYAD